MMFSFAFADFEHYKLDEANNGVVIVTYPVETGARYKVMLSKDDERYYYDLTSSEERFPLQMGEGTYELAVLKSFEGTIYSYEYKTAFTVDNIDEESVFLNSIQNIDWNESNEAIKFVDELVEDSMTDIEKIETIQEYIAENYRYDYEKFATIKGAYLPSIDLTFEAKSGICYDFSSLLASMLRSEGIQTKLVMGYRADTTVYHAWNEVRINDRWLTIDITLDSEYSQKGFEYGLFKDSSLYEANAEY